MKKKTTKTTKKTTKTTKNANQFVSVFSMNETKRGYVLNPDFRDGKGVKAITITLHDGTEVELNDETPIWLNQVPNYDFYSSSLKLGN